MYEYVWLMDKSLEKLCHLVYNRLGKVIPELIVGEMAEAVSGKIACVVN